MAGLRWFDYQWLPADDRFIFGDLYAPAAGESQGLRWEVANGADDFRVEQRRLVGRELGIACSGVAFSCEGLAIRSRWPSRLVADNARTRAVIVTLRIG